MDPVGSPEVEPSESVVLVGLTEVESESVDLVGLSDVPEDSVVRP